MKQARRKNTSVLLSDGRCGLCGAGLLLVSSRRVRPGFAWLNPLWDPEPRQHETCPDCGATMEVS